MKEHPQYGTRIPPEELEFMRQQAEERARERKNRPAGSRGYGSGGGYRERTPGAPRGGPRSPGGPRPVGGPRRTGGPHVPGGAPRTTGTYRSPSGHAPRREQRGPGEHRPGPPYGSRPPRPHGVANERGTEFRPARDRFSGTGRAGGTGAPTRPERRPLRPFRTGVQSAGEGPPRPSPAPEEPPLLRIQSILSGYQQSAALIAGHSLGVFAAIAKQPQAASDVARHCGADPRGMAALLEALVSLGILHRHGATYVLPRELGPYLVPGSDGDATGMLEAASELYAAWGDLPRAIREGEPRMRLSTDALLAGEPARVRKYIRAVHTVSREAARRLPELAPLLPGSSLLDVAGGSGAFAAEYARRTPGLTATLFELPPTLDAAREILEAEKYEERITFVPGDYREDPFPGPVDTLLLSNVLQTESEEQAIAILRKAWEAVRPGGTLLIHGVMPEEGGPVPAGVALFALRMFLLFDEGRAWSVERVTEWLAQERFAVRATRSLGSPFQSKLIVASRLE